MRVRIRCFGRLGPLARSGRVFPSRPVALRMNTRQPPRRFHPLHDCRSTLSGQLFRRSRAWPRTDRSSVRAFHRECFGRATPGRFSPFGRVSQSSGPTSSPRTTPSADFSAAVRKPRGFLSPQGTRPRSPGISSTAFRARPPDLRFAPLMDMEFAVIGPLVRRSRLRSGFCTSARAFAPRFLRPPPRHDALALRYPSPPSGWVGTFTPELSNMPGVTKKAPGVSPGGPFVVRFFGAGGLLDFLPVILRHVRGKLERAVRAGEHRLMDL